MLNEEKFSVSTPAKLNLILKIIGRRDDGYHLLYTLFHKIDLYDYIEIRVEDPGRGINLTCPPGLSDGPDNLVCKAASSFMKMTGLNAGLEILLEKNIPMGGGLGGGSSDAAATLRLLNEIFESPLDDRALYGLASSLGADVPFFLLDSPSAIGTGTGTVLTTVDFAPSVFLLVLPDFGVNTAWAYKNYQFSPSETFSFNQDRIESNVLWQNDLERPVFKKYPVLEDAKRGLLDSGARAAMMSGSGSTLFGVFENRQNAENSKNLLNLPLTWQTAVAQSADLRL